MVAGMVAIGALAACGGDGGGLTVEKETPPREIVAATNLSDVHSGVLEGSIAVRNAAEEDGFNTHLTVGIARSQGGALPPFFVAIGSPGVRDGRSFEVNERLFYSPTGATFVYGPAFHELSFKPDRSDFKHLNLELERAQASDGAGNLSACRAAAEGFPLASLVESPKYLGTAEASTDNTRLFLVGGTIDLAALNDFLAQLGGDAACAAQMRALGLPSVLQAPKPAPKEEAEENLVVLGVDRHGRLRSFEATLDVAGPQQGRTEIEVSLSLREINQDVEVPASASGKPLGLLLRKFGVEPAEGLSAGGEELVIGLLKGLSGSVTGRLP
jgi:hypothetical protein